LGEKIMGDAHLLADLEADLGSSFDLLAILSKGAESDQERAKLLSINQALTAVAAKIDQKELTSRSDAVSALMPELSFIAYCLESGSGPRATREDASRANCERHCRAY
jgi:hypothetical protein